MLATDVYKQVIGQQNMSMGATVGLILLIPAIFAFAVDRITQRKQANFLSSKAVPYRIIANKKRDVISFIYCSVITFTHHSVICGSWYCRKCESMAI